MRNKILAHSKNVISTSFGKSKKLVGLNNRWRVGRYEKGDYFHTHTDGTFSYTSTIGSALTLMIYLNSPDSTMFKFKGGNTEFVTPTRELKYAIVPRTGLG